MFEWLIVLSLQFVIFGSGKKCLQNFCSIEKWMVLKFIDKNTSEIMTLLNKLVLICRLKDYDLVFFSLCMIRKICFSAKLWFVKSTTRIVKYVHTFIYFIPEWN